MIHVQGESGSAGGKGGFPWGILLCLGGLARVSKHLNFYLNFKEISFYINCFNFLETLPLGAIISLCVTWNKPPKSDIEEAQPLNK